MANNPVPKESADMGLLRWAQAGDLDAFEALAIRCAQRACSLPSNTGEEP